MEKKIELTERLIAKAKEIRESLPYEINLAEVIGMDENAHSRVLMRLLSYNKNGKYPILESFLGWFKIGHSDNSTTIKMNSPSFSCDGGDRIDLLITDKNNAIIIENKVCGASDQDRQLVRYRKEVMNKGYDLQNIYIIYLTENGGEPGKTSIGKFLDKDGYIDVVKETGDGHLICENYRDSMRNWLNSLEIPINETYLHSLLKEYIYYLKICYMGTDSNEKIMEQFVSEIINNDNEVCHEISKIEKAFSKISDVSQKVNAIRRERICNWFNSIRENLDAETLYSRFNKRYNVALKTNYPSVGLIFKIKDGVEFACIIEKRLGSFNENPFIAIWAPEAKKKQEVIEFIESFIEEYDEVKFKLNVKSVKKDENQTTEEKEQKGYFYTTKLMGDYSEIETSFHAICKKLINHFDKKDPKEVEGSVK